MKEKDEIVEQETLTDEAKQKLETVMAPEQVAQMEQLIKERFEYKEKWPHRHEKYNKYENAQQVKCAKCGETKRLTLTTEKKESSFKKSQYVDKNGNIKGHKKTRNDIPVLDKNGNKIYFCIPCIVEEAKRLRKEGLA